jgi:hypothetical protein
MKSAVLAILLSFLVGTSARGQEPLIADTPTVKVLRGLTVQQFEAEMQLMNQALGVSCGFCHARGNFAAETNPRKATARRMIEMVRAIDQQYFPDHRPADGESRLGKVSCFTCHQGSERPKAAPAQ